MKRERPVILIGPYEDDPTESVSAVNRCFVDGLSDKYLFIPHVANRSFGGTRRARFNFGNALFFLKHFALWLRRVVHHRPDIVHYSINSGWALEKSLMFLRVGRVFGAKTIGHLHSGSFLDFWATLPAGRKRRAQRQLDRLDALVVLSDAWKRRVVEHLGLPPEKVFVVNNPLDRAFEERALAMPVERTGNMLLAVGVMDSQKGVLDLIEAAALAREHAAFSLVIAGPEREPGIRTRVERMIAEKNLGAVVQLRPGVWGEEKAELFRAASAFLLPSYFENFPVVVLEAAAAGLPMIVTPVGATTEFFTDEKSALFVPVGDARQISEAIVRVCTEPELGARLGGAARAVFVDRLARTNIMRALDTVYAAVLKARIAASAASPTGQKVSHESPNV